MVLKKEQSDNIIINVENLQVATVKSLVRSKKVNRSEILKYIIKSKDDIRSEAFNELLEQRDIDDMIKRLDDEVYIISKAILKKKTLNRCDIHTPLFSLFFADTEFKDLRKRFDYGKMTKIFDGIISSNAKGKYLMIHYIFKIYSPVYMKEFNEKVRRGWYDNESSLYNRQEHNDTAQAVARNLPIIDYMVRQCKKNDTRAYEQPNSLRELKEEISAIKKFNKVYESES